jgi:hypothetical protein
MPKRRRGAGLYCGPRPPCHVLLTMGVAPRLYRRSTAIIWLAKASRSAITEMK